MYVLSYMVVTFQTCHAERSPLKATALINTAPHTQQQRKKSNDKNGLKKKEGRALLKRISAKKKGRRENETDKKRPDLEERGGRCVLT